MVLFSAFPRLGLRAGLCAASVFAAPGLAHAASETMLYAFAGGTDGANPAASLIDVGGTLYGTTYSGGQGGCGTVYQVTQGGAEVVLYAFKCGTDGANPEANLLDVGGTLYGTTLNGGANASGTVFAVTLAGAETVAYSFAGGKDGAHPAAGLINAGGTLFGTTRDGGGSRNCKAGCGTVFSLTASGREKVIHAFTGGTDGANPYASLLDVGGTLYGTTYFGGKTWGTVFSVTKAGVEKVVYAFKGPALGDAGFPAANLINVRGTLYGTTVSGGNLGNCGDQGCGTVFKLTTAGAENVVHSFGVGEGTFVYAGLVNVNGTLYGGTTNTTNDGAGTVFKLGQGGSLKVIYQFGVTNSIASRLVDVDGTLYGVVSGGTNGAGAVFKLVP